MGAVLYVDIFIMKLIYTLFFGVFIGACFGDAVSEDIENVMVASALMWDKVDNYGGKIDLDMQDSYKENSNTKYDKLVKKVDSDVLKGATFDALNDLFDVYDTDDFESQQLEDFIEKVIDTDVMKTLCSYLLNQTDINSEAEFKSEFKRIWFESYDYEDMDGNKTSGFNHVFMGEVNDTGVHGFHNWVRYYNEEDAGNLQYKGWTGQETVDGDMSLVNLSFEWNNAVKPVSTIPFGTTPEYELAVLTLCYYMLPGDECFVAMGDGIVNIVTEVANVNNTEYVRTAYFTLTDANGASSVIRPDIVLSMILCFLFSWRNFAL